MRFHIIIVYDLEWNWLIVSLAVLIACVNWNRINILWRIRILWHRVGGCLLWWIWIRVDCLLRWNWVGVHRLLMLRRVGINWFLIRVPNLLLNRIGVDRLLREWISRLRTVRITLLLVSVRCLIIDENRLSSSGVIASSLYHNHSFSSSATNTGQNNNYNEDGKCDSSGNSTI
jgi:hypothetical protein